MNRSTAMRLVLVGFAIAVVMISWREIQAGKGAPVPGRFWNAAIVYGFAGVIAEFAAGLGAALAVGWTFGLAVGLLSNDVPIKTSTPAGQSYRPGRAGGGGGGGAS